MNLCRFSCHDTYRDFHNPMNYEQRKKRTWQNESINLKRQPKGESEAYIQVNILLFAV